MRERTTASTSVALAGLLCPAAVPGEAGMVIDLHLANQRTDLALSFRAGPESYASESVKTICAVVRSRNRGDWNATLTLPMAVRDQHCCQSTISSLPMQWYHNCDQTSAHAPKKRRVSRSGSARKATCQRIPARPGLGNRDLQDPRVFQTYLLHF
ncbi:uncharacterized protein B0I36DRAFT_106239 [Microdochium trichocladiopsis]|uniref:Uncharacterized protein n=1 Tax=Microdochium trichocladiopsis TaxID=1682393 RepID=A0A9P8Y9F6_9PEZI|nr:uncharacterized protein B0I36DRAFT_106239 [Microdochium trichocladiopsis]KAH7033215.1 hypothetical protein B0I36DRAFT_106239 [Microdochium trichocladiopsis]